MNRYTNGPLLVKVFAPTIVENYDFHVCTEREECVATCWGQDDVAEANAKLYAAAPELLEALKFAKDQWQHSTPSDCYSQGPCTGDLIQDYVACPGCEVQRRIDAAIAKAVAA